MHLVSQVVFNYGLYDNTTRIGEECSFNTLEELKLAIQNGKDYYKTPYKLNVLLYFCFRNLRTSRGYVNSSVTIILIFLLSKTTGF